MTFPAGYESIRLPPIGQGSRPDDRNLPSLFDNRKLYRIDTKLDWSSTCSTGPSSPSSMAESSDCGTPDSEFSRDPMHYGRTTSVSSKASHDAANSTSRKRCRISMPARVVKPKGAKDTKAADERENRNIQAMCLQDMEDMLEIMLDWQFEETQNPGNANLSGLKAPKILGLKIAQALLSYSLDTGLRQAIEEDRVDEWRAEMTHIGMGILQGENPLGHTMMADLLGDRRCERDQTTKSGKRCQVHGTDDHLVCRKQTRKHALKVNIAEYRERNHLRLSTSTGHVPMRTRG